MLIDNERQEIKFFINDIGEPGMPGKMYGFSEIGSSDKELFNAGVQGVKDIATEIPFNTFNTLMGAIVNKVSMAEHKILNDIDTERKIQLEKKN